LLANVSWYSKNVKVGGIVFSLVFPCYTVLDVRFVHSMFTPFGEWRDLWYVFTLTTSLAKGAL